MGHQTSTIDRLPEDIREQLQELLRDPRVTQLAATGQINAILETEGHPERVSKSAVNRYAMRMEAVGAKLRESREVAKVWVGRLGAEPQGDIGKLLNEIARGMAFDACMDKIEGEAPVEPKFIKDIAIAIDRLERAASENVKRDEAIRKQALTDAADVVEETARQQGLDKEQAQFWREQVLGISK
ncbi:MAG: DUF3486 family protein [Deltaproteobacteria bacterium]|nr:DUF3486 family protein [Deltaproteobacteria bacterium]